jgi:Lon protease-like protein
MQVGVLAAVQSITQLPDNTLVVEYEGQRRFSLLLVDDDEKPYKVGCVSMCCCGGV